jgi:hypothetical protein
MPPKLKVVRDGTQSHNAMIGYIFRRSWRRKVDAGVALAECGMQPDRIGGMFR